MTIKRTHRLRAYDDRFAAGLCAGFMWTRMRRMSSRGEQFQGILYAAISFPQAKY